MGAVRTGGAIWARQVRLATLAFLAAAEGSFAPAALRPLLPPSRRARPSRRSSLRTIGICGGRHVPRREWAVVTRARGICCSRSSSCRSPCRSSSARSGASVVHSPGRYLGFLALYDALVRGRLLGRRFEYVVVRVSAGAATIPEVGRTSRIPLPAARRDHRSCSSRRRSRSYSSSRRPTRTRASRSGSSTFHRLDRDQPRTPCFAGAAWQAFPRSVEARPARRPQELRLPSTRGSSFGTLVLITGSIWGEDLVGPAGGCGARTSSCLFPRSFSSSYCAYFMLRFLGRSRSASART